LLKEEVVPEKAKVTLVPALFKVGTGLLLLYVIEELPPAIEYPPIDTLTLLAVPRTVLTPELEEEDDTLTLTEA
jgi:hypothetical protein